MRTVILLLGIAGAYSGCTQLLAKDDQKTSLQQPVVETTTISNTEPPDDRLRVGRDEATAMRNRRGNDDASVKISVKDLQSLLEGPVSEKDSFIFYFVKYRSDAQEEMNRYRIKVPNANWFGHVMRKPSSLLVGYVPGETESGGSVLHRRALTTVKLFDLAVVCPPPPDCNCSIAR